MYNLPSMGASFQNGLVPSHNSAGQGKPQREHNTEGKADMADGRININQEAARSEHMSNRHRDTNSLQKYDRQDMRSHFSYTGQHDDVDEFGKADQLFQKTSTSLRQRPVHTGIHTSGRNTNPFITDISLSDQLLTSQTQDNITTIRQIVQDVVNESLIANMTAIPSESSTPRINKQVKIQPFNGQTSMETFLAHFQLASDYNKWTPSDQLMHLKLNLTGSASNILWDITPDKTDTVEKLKAVLIARFGTSGFVERFRVELRTRRRQPKETLQELLSDIQRLTTLAFPGPVNQTTEILAKEAYIDALDDEDMAMKIREREPSNLEEAARIAVRLESYKRLKKPEPMIQLVDSNATRTNDTSTSEVLMTMKEMLLAQQQYQKVALDEQRK